MTIDIQNISKLLYVSKESASVYLEIFTNSKLSIEKLVTLTSLSLQEVKDSVNELISRGFIQKIQGVNEDNVFQAMSMMQIESRLNRDVESFNHLKKIILPQVQKPDRLEIMKYDGWEGIRQVYLEVLEEAVATGEDIYAFEYNLDNSNIGEKFFDLYIKNRIQNKVIAHVICPENVVDKQYKNEIDGQFTNIKLLKDFSVNANINIVGELVMVFSTDYPRGTLRRNKAEADTLRSVFKKLWNLV